MKQRKKETELPFVEIIIVSYNGMQYIGKCLASLQKLKYPSQQYHITVVDNHSQDGTLEYVQQNFLNVTLIKNTENIGFGRANNIGIAQSSPETKYIALLNQDSLVDTHWLSELVKTMEENSTAGACGATQKDYALYGNKFPREERIKDCIWMGCGSIIFRKKALEDIQQNNYFFDPFYFMYVEDIDITWRLKIAGWKILHTFNAFWFHEGRKRAVSYDDKRLFWSWKNRVYLLFKFASWKQIFSSLQIYSSHFLYKKKRKVGVEQNIQKFGETQQKNNYQKDNKLFFQKVAFFMRFFCAMTYTVPYALLARHNLRQKLALQQKEIDTWIAYLDRVFFGLED